MIFLRKHFGYTLLVMFLYFAIGFIDLNIQAPTQFIYLFSWK